MFVLTSHPDDFRNSLSVSRFLCRECQISAVNVFAIKTISCRLTISHLLTSLNIPCFIIFFFCRHLIVKAFYSRSLWTQSTKFPHMLFKTISIFTHDWGERILKIYTCTVLGFVSCCINVTWICWKLWLCQMIRIFRSSVTPVCVPDTTFPCELPDFSPSVDVILCLAGVTKVHKISKCLWDHEVISYKCQSCLSEWHMLQ